MYSGDSNIRTLPVSSPATRAWSAAVRSAAASHARLSRMAIVRAAERDECAGGKAQARISPSPADPRPLDPRDSASERLAAMPDKSTSGSSVGAQPITGRAGADRCARNWAIALAPCGRHGLDPRAPFVAKASVSAAL
jgi:hypothetical protein